MYVYGAELSISLVLFQIGVIMGITFAPDWLTGQGRRVLYKDQVSGIKTHSFADQQAVQVVNESGITRTRGL